MWRFLKRTKKSQDFFDTLKSESKDSLFFVLIGAIALRPVGGVGVIGQRTAEHLLVVLDQATAFIGNPHSPELVEMSLSW